MHEHLPKNIPLKIKRLVQPYLVKAAANSAGEYSDKCVVVKAEDLLRIWELAHQVASLRSMK